MECNRQKMESLVLEVNKSHLNDLKSFFDETKKLKSIINTLFEKVENVSDQMKNNLNFSQKLESKLQTYKEENQFLNKKIEHVDEETQK